MRVIKYDEQHIDYVNTIYLIKIKYHLFSTRKISILKLPNNPIFLIRFV